MGKIRVYQVAKELGLENRELVARIQSMGIDVRNYMSSLEPDDVVHVKRLFEKQRHEEMVEEEIKPGVTRRRSLRPQSSAQMVTAAPSMAGPSAGPVVTTSSVEAAATPSPIRRRPADRPHRPGPAA